MDIDPIKGDRNMFQIEAETKIPSHKSGLVAKMSVLGLQKIFRPVYGKYALPGPQWVEG